jgi:hypothetical protein
MRTFGTILCSVLLMAMAFFPGCTTQDIGYPDATAAQQGVTGSPLVTTPAPLFVNLHLPLHRQRQLYMHTPYRSWRTPAWNRSSPTSLKLYAQVVNIRLTLRWPNVYGLASDPDAGMTKSGSPLVLTPAARHWI